MRQRIFRVMSLLTVISVCVVAIVSTYMDYQNFERRIKSDLKDIAGLISDVIETNGTDDLVDLDVNSEYRVTHIGSDGSVLYDNKVLNAELDQLPNHLDRPEVQEALKTGEGKASRYSTTLSVNTYYFAQKLEDGSILRISMEEESEMALVIELLPELCVIIFLILLFAFVISRYQTKRIVDPINQINFDNQDEIEGDVYEELYPFIQKIRRQRQVIEEQIRDIRSSKGEFEAITENMSEGLIVIDKNENVIFYNKSALMMLDINEDSGRVRNFVAFNRNENLIRHIEQALNGERSTFILPVKEKVYQVVTSPVIIEDEINGAVMVILDETEKELRDELRREFSANVSHELKTPLTSISGYAEIMESGMVKEEDMIKFSGIIHTEARRLINLVEDIIKISRLDDSQVELEKEEVDLSELAAENISNLKNLADGKQISMVLLGNGGIVYGVRQILDEMVRNLIENAIKYNKDHGNVIVSVDTYEESSEGETGRIILTVKDNGIGIPQSDIERVFERFYRVDKSHTKAIGGTGLGLSIVKHGAIYHGAKIEIESELEVGTTMKIIFPQMKQDENESGV